MLFSVLVTFLSNAFQFISSDISLKFRRDLIVFENSSNIYCTHFSVIFASLVTNALYCIFDKYLRILVSFPSKWTWKRHAKLSCTKTSCKKEIMSNSSKWTINNRVSTLRNLFLFLFFPHMQDNQESLRIPWMRFNFPIRRPATIAKILIKTFFATVSHCCFALTMGADKPIKPTKRPLFLCPKPGGKKRGAGRRRKCNSHGIIK